MGKTREIKKRIKAVGNIRRITKTMQMIATAKFSAAQQRSVASRPYTDTLFELVSDLSAKIGESGDVSHPLLASPSGGKGKSAPELTLVITSDRGLCGPYNGSILRMFVQLTRANLAVKAGRVELVGKKGTASLKFNNIPVTRAHSFGDKPSYETINELAQTYIDAFSRGEVSLVRVVYMKYISAGRQTPTVMQLLPFKADQVAALAKKAGEPAKKSAWNLIYEFEPSAGELLGELLPAAVKAVLFQAFNDAIVSEHVARMIAMKSATDNAGKMGKRLTRQYNRARQAQITTELTEIIGGAAALE